MSIKKIADEVYSLSKDFEPFIVEQILSSKSNFDEEPCFSISHRDFIIDVWKKKNNYEIIKSVLPSSNKKLSKDFRKTMKKKEIVEEIINIIDEFLD